VVEMVFEVNFALKVNGKFHVVHKAFVFAESVSDCQEKSEGIREELSLNKNHHIHIFIEA
jgi:hypothetical protein